MKQLLVVLLLILFLLIPANAQTFRGAINGTVTDPSGAVVPEAHVKATNKATGLDYALESTSDGQVAFHYSPLGTSEVGVMAPAFSPVEVDTIRLRRGAIFTPQV